MRLFLGCYTDDAHPHGLFVLDLDPATGVMCVVDSLPVKGATYQALSPDGRLLVSGTMTGLASFRADGPRLEPVDALDLGGTVCHVSLSPDARTAFWANYLGGRCGSVALAADGRFGAVRAWQHEGDGPNKPRQDKAHCHQALPAPDGRGFYVVDLGLDRVVRYPDGLVIPTPPPGAGPRHLLFHPNGSLGFLLYELGNRLASFRIRPDGAFDFLDAKPTLPPGDTGRGYNGDLAAAIRFSPDGRRVVVSNRGENSLLAFDFDPATGSLDAGARTLLPGSWPRDFIFVSDTLALVTMERSGEVLSLRYDPATGSFEVLSALSGLFRPVALTRAPGPSNP